MNVIENDKLSEKYPCVLYFTASWCGPCKRISPVFEDLANKNKDIHFFKIDVDSNQKLATMYSIKAMPTFIFFSEESCYTNLMGADVEALKKNVENLKSIKK